MDFESGVVSQDEGAELMPVSTRSFENSQVGKFKRSKIVVAAALLLGCACGMITMHKPANSVETKDLDLDTSLENFYSALKGFNIDGKNLDQQIESNNYNYTATGMSKDAFDQLLKFRRQLRIPYDSRQLASASCAVDITQAIFFLERAALSITAATASCVGGSAHVQAACAVDISAVYASFAFFAEYISEAVAQCKVGHDYQAQCSAGISGIIANTARLSVTAATMAGNCNPGGIAYGKPSGEAFGDVVWQMTRRLQRDEGEGAIHPKFNAAAAGIATCALDVPQAATYLAMFGIAIDRATRDCRRANFLGGISLTKNNPKVYCAASIFEILESISMVGAFISSAVSHCAPQTNQQALCASGAIGVVGGITGLAKDGLWIQEGCTKGKGHLPIPVPIIPLPCLPIPGGCPTNWKQPKWPKCSFCPKDGICRKGQVCYCLTGKLKECQKGSTCYSASKIDTCTGANCCSVKRINECDKKSKCTSTSLGHCEKSSTCVQKKINLIR